jgi:endoplasmic reticulum junction formation protein lunapark
MAFFSFLSWFKPWWKTTETDYETVLSRLTKDINDVQARLIRVNQRERRSSITLTLYAILLWLIYTLFVYLTTTEKRPLMTKSERFHVWLPSVLGLMLIISVRSIVRWWFRRVSAGEEKHLRSLQRTRRKKIDEIKQATKFDHLRSLLERYDDTAVNRPGMKRVGSSMDGKQNKQVQQTTKSNEIPQGSRQFQGMKDGKPVNGSSQSGQRPVELLSTPVKSNQKTVQGQPISTIVTTGSGTSLPFETPQQHLRFQKTWLDRVADKILGVETNVQDGGAEQRYALICHVCLTHNGLCPKEDWEEVQYICPRCGTFNSRRPSSVPVPSPWSASSAANRRASLGTPSPAKSLRDLPPGSPSVKSVILESASAPSGFGNTTEFEGEEKDDEEEAKKQKEDSIDDDEINQDELETEAEKATRRGARTTARQEKDDGLMLRKRQGISSIGDESAEPMQVD